MADKISLNTTLRMLRCFYTYHVVKEVLFWWDRYRAVNKIISWENVFSASLY